MQMQKAHSLDSIFFVDAKADHFDFWGTGSEEEYRKQSTDDRGFVIHKFGYVSYILRV
jgi:hypothetical protein